jgi:hypothetical protein
VCERRATPLRGPSATTRSISCNVRRVHSKIERTQQNQIRPSVIYLIVNKLLSLSLSLSLSLLSPVLFVKLSVFTQRPMAQRAALHPIKPWETPLQFYHQGRATTHVLVRHFGVLVCAGSACCHGSSSSCCCSGFWSCCGRGN